MKSICNFSQKLVKHSVTMEKSRPKNLTETLIHEVQSRPLLWDKYNDLYNNRSATDREWGSLSVIMKQHKDHLRQKWKNLRDQFQKELKKVQTPVGDTVQSYIENYTGKWIYFGQLLFLKDTIRIKVPNNTTADVEIPNEEIKEELTVHEEDLIRCADVDKFESNSGHSLNEILPCNSRTTEIVENIYSEGEKEHSIRKRRASEEPQDPCKCQRLSLAGHVEALELDDDLHFFKSIIPFMRKLNPIRKLMVRNEIQNILLRENLYDKYNGNSC